MRFREYCYAKFRLVLAVRYRLWRFSKSRKSSNHFEDCDAIVRFKISGHGTEYPICFDELKRCTPRQSSFGAPDGQFSNSFDCAVSAPTTLAAVISQGEILKGRMIAIRFQLSESQLEKPIASGLHSFFFTGKEEVLFEDGAVKISFISRQDDW